MKRRFQRLRRWLIALAMAGTGRGIAEARPPVYQEPQWMTWHLSHIDVGMYTEGSHQESSFENSGNSSSHDSFFIGPSIGLGFNGSIYHPNFLRYDVSGEYAPGWRVDHVKSAAGTITRNQEENLGWFSANLLVLPGKPYHGNLFSSYTRSFRKNDFFTEVTVDSWRYGGALSYEAGPWLFGASYNHHDETSTSLVGNSTSHEDVVDFSAGHNRTWGSSTFHYTAANYSRVNLGSVGEGTDHTLTFADNEQFGSRGQYRFNGNASYTIRETDVEANRELLADANLTADHRPTLSSAYDFSYNHFTSDNDFKSDNYTAQAQLTHRLYESLVSTVTLRGADYEASDQINSGYTRRFGGGITENYTKRIGSEHRLRIINTLFIDHTDQHTLGTIKNESHTFDEAGAPPNSFFLNLANVIEATIVVTDQADSQPPYILNIDYAVFTDDDRTVIERLPGSSIPDGATVLVDYQTLSSAEGSYETFTEAFQIRFEFWKNLWGVYGRVNISDNNAAEDLRIHDVTIYTAGTDFNWRWFRAGAEYQIYNSDLSAYQAVRLFQSATFHPDRASSLSLNLAESWLDYSDVGRKEENFRFTTRYSRRVSHRLGLAVDGGFAYRKGNNVDQVLATFRPTLRYVIGKTSIDAVYDYEYQLFLNREQREKHMFYVRLKRTF